MVAKDFSPGVDVIARGVYIMYFSYLDFRDGQPSDTTMLGPTYFTG